MFQLVHYQQNVAWLNNRWFVDAIDPIAPSEIAQVFHNQQNPSGSATAGSLIKIERTPKRTPKELKRVKLGKADLCWVANEIGYIGGATAG